MCETRRVSVMLPAAVGAAALCAVVVSAAAAAIVSALAAVLAAAGLLTAAGVAWLVHVLRRDGLRLYAPADVEPVPLALAAARARAIEAPRTVIPGVVLDGAADTRSM